MEADEAQNVVQNNVELPAKLVSGNAAVQNSTADDAETIKDLQGRVEQLAKIQAGLENTVSAIESEKAELLNTISYREWTIEILRRENDYVTEKAMGYEEKIRGLESDKQSLEQDVTNLKECIGADLEEGEIRESTLTAHEMEPASSQRRNDQDMREGGGSATRSPSLRRDMTSPRKRQNGVERRRSGGRSPSRQRRNSYYDDNREAHYPRRGSPRDRRDRPDNVRGSDRDERRDREVSRFRHEQEDGSGPGRGSAFGRS